MWPSGTCIVQEEHFAGHVVTARPVRVVDDTPQLLVLYTAAGSTQVDGTMRNRSRLSIEERMRVYADDAPQPLTERPSRWNVLTLNVPGASHAYWVFWTPAWEHFGWFVNFQSPFQRTDDRILLGARAGESRGLNLLDLFVTPELEWSWKDLDELDAAHEHGMITAAERQAQLDEAARVIEVIENRRWPFDEPWPAWRPDPAWTVPHVRLTGARSWALIS
jgi:hypothetical protein